ncbi:hypothetical protein J2T56_002261 [Natronobacillus azotifigens]|uniref:Sporulation protein YqfD n=1 Tax=Natronobacillus azotifigens TaxID=472978 RepID=A0A9J6RFT9_9BACI|nr:sporulation protein YqfD [Natronobacillus azotifigens]MCZ0704025.1 sporulation protein YqfD [Natronobacillus azotifigens]
MKQIQAKWLKGYVRIQVTGYYPELFFDLCVRNGVRVWSIRKINQTTCTGDVFLQDISLIRRLRKKTRYKLSFSKRIGAPFAFRRIGKKKPLLTALICSLILIIYLSNLIWNIEITGVRPEVQKKIQQTLSNEGIYRGRLKFLVDSPDQIQKKLLEEHPELLWVGVQPQGTSYHLEVVEKTQVPQQEVGKASNIIASKDGVIVDMYVEKGRPLVEINDFVRKGQTLVAGKLTAKEDEESEEQKNGSPPVAAKAEIYANTWYESNLSVPLETSYEVLTGEESNKYYLGISSLRIPIWGFFQKKYEDHQIETNKHSLQLFQWELPIYWIKEEIYQLEYVEEKRTVEQARQVGLHQAKEELQQMIGRDAKIIDQKILHESLENGKVNLHLYFTVEENIAKIQGILQGD